MVVWRRLPRGFFVRDTHAVARDLLGKLLVRRWRGSLLAARIYEVESYVGENDRACHAARGLTPRTKIMFGEAGHAYVYLVYGMYHCLNVVTEREGFPAAVLVRGAVVTEGARNLSVRTKGVRNLLVRVPDTLLNGPGKLCRALYISRAQNGEDLVTSELLFVADDGMRLSPTRIVTTPRIGVDYAGEDAKLPWRYVVSL